MTIKEQNELFESLPAGLAEQYGFGGGFDYSRYIAVRGDGYVYYPEINTIVVDDAVGVEWETDGADICEVDLGNAEHLEVLLSRARQRMDAGMAGIICPGVKHPMMCRMRRGAVAGPYKSIPVDGAHIYYLPGEFDLEHDKGLRTLAECLFIARRYSPVQIVPYKDVEPEEWGGNCI